ncbi:MAG: response regulator [Pseudomonadota bacterium]
MSARVLLVDDETDLLEVMAERLGVRGIEVFTADSPQTALDMITIESFDAVILDFSMPGMDGMQALKLFREKKPELQVILLTGYGTVNKGVEAMKLGAFDFIEKPAEIGKLVQKIEQAKAQRLRVLQKQQEEKIKELVRKVGG